MKKRQYPISDPTGRLKRKRKPPKDMSAQKKEMNPMKKPLIQRLGLTGLLALLSYTAAVVFAPLAYPGYDWMSQAVSDLSAESAPSRLLWSQLSALYDICGVVCATSAAVYVSERKTSLRLFRAGIYLFTFMTWISAAGYAMFPLADAGKDIAAFQEIMHLAVTALVVLLSIASLAALIAAGRRDKGVRGLGIWAGIALLMMMGGSIASGAVPPAFFGIAERFSVFAAVGFEAVLGMYLFRGMEK